MWPLVKRYYCNTQGEPWDCVNLYASDHTGILSCKSVHFLAPSSLPNDANLRTLFSRDISDSLDWLTPQIWQWTLPTLRVACSLQVPIIRRNVHFSYKNEVPPHDQQTDNWVFDQRKCSQSCVHKDSWFNSAITYLRVIASLSAAAIGGRTFVAWWVRRGVTTCSSSSNRSGDMRKNEWNDPILSLSSENHLANSPNASLLVDCPCIRHEPDVSLLFCSSSCVKRKRRANAFSLSIAPNHFSTFKFQPHSSPGPIKPRQQTFRKQICEILFQSSHRLCLRWHHQLNWSTYLSIYFLTSNWLISATSTTTTK